MAKLDNARHELFAQKMAAGSSGSKSYVAAGYSAKGNAAEVNAARLLRNAQVRSRIAELKQARYDREVLDRAWVTKRLMDMAENSESDNACIRALELLGKHLGMFREGGEEQPLPTAPVTREGNNVVDFNSMLRD